MCNVYECFQEELLVKYSEETIEDIKITIELETFPIYLSGYIDPCLVVTYSRITGGFIAKIELGYKYFEDFTIHVERAELLMANYKDYVKLYGASSVNFEFKFKGNKYCSLVLQANFDMEINLNSLNIAADLLINQMLTMFILID